MKAKKDFNKIAKCFKNNVISWQRNIIDTYNRYLTSIINSKLINNQKSMLKRILILRFTIRKKEIKLITVTLSCKNVRFFGL